MTGPGEAASSPARAMWQRIETLHAVTYFAPESHAAAKAAGLKGFWMGYFGFRAAPLGPVGPGIVEAAFANFAPGMVCRAVPDAWTFAEPADLLVARASSAAAALRRVAPEIDILARSINDRLAPIAALATPMARPLFAANREVPAFEDPVAQLWQHCTTLREHRGDGHVVALAAAGVDGCEAHQLLLAESGAPIELVRDNRGWTDEDWVGAASRLASRGLVDGGALTDEGRALRANVEATTDRLALAPMLAAMSTTDLDRLIVELTPTASIVASSGVLPFPNPMGLPQLSE